MDKLIRILGALGIAVIVGNAVSPSHAQSFGDAFVGVGDNDEPVNIEAGPARDHR